MRTSQSPRTPRGGGGAASGSGSSPSSQSSQETPRSTTSSRRGSSTPSSSRSRQSRRGQAAAAATATAAVPHVVPPLPPPQQHRPIAQLHTFVDVCLNELEKANTKKAYIRRINEYKSFCDHVYGSLPQEVRYTVDEDRLYRFLFYHVFREQYTSTGKKGEHGFDVVDYNRVMNKYGARSLSTAGSENAAQNQEDDGISEPVKPLGADSINSYNSAVRKYYDKQAQHNANNLRWDQIRTSRVTSLVKIVQGRGKRVKKRNFEEKIDSCTTPFTNFHQVKVVEEALWNKGCMCSRKTFCSLRNRFSFLMNFAAILRNESVHLAELSDLFHFYILRDEDYDPMPIMMMKVATGKTISAESPDQYGRATRHKDVFQCAVGACGLYLLFRFEVNSEFDPESFFPDFRDNSTWFEVKLLTELGGDINKELQQRPYQDAIKDVFKELRIVSNHYGHFGRCTAPLLAEFKELSPDMIKILGNWDRDTQESRYSAKVPLQALRVMAGFNKDDGYWLPRSQVKPSEELKAMIWPWISDSLEYVLEDGEKNHPTAIAYLQFLDFLREVILQDVACMLVIWRGNSDNSDEDDDDDDDDDDHDDDDVSVSVVRRLRHNVLKMNVFKSELFEKFVKEMKEKLDAQALPSNDPNLKSLDRALPGVNLRFDQLETKMREIYGIPAKIKTVVTEAMVDAAKDVGKFVQDKCNEVLEEVGNTEDRLLGEIRKGHTVLGRFFKCMKTASESFQGLDELADELLEEDAEKQSPPSQQPFVQQQQEEQQQQYQIPPSSLPPPLPSQPERQQQQAGEGTDEMATIANVQVSFRNKATKKLFLSDMYKEFYGLERFEGCPIDGGFHGLERKYKNKWRKGYKSHDSNFFSRLSRLMKSMADKAGVEQGVWNDAVEEVADLWQEYISRNGLAGAVEKLQADGHIAKTGTRKRKETSG